MTQQEYVNLLEKFIEANYPPAVLQELRRLAFDRGDKVLTERLQDLAQGVIWHT